MKKVGLISRHNVANYGSFLQAYASETVIRNLGYDAITVDYIRQEESADSLAKAHSASKPFVHKLYYRTIWKALYQEKANHFRKIQKQYLNLTPECDNQSIAGLAECFDVYCTGSDQVWNLMSDGSLDKTYLWDQVESNSIISYAASFGTEAIRPEDTPMLKQLLSRYRKISVREDTGVSILESLGLAGDQVLDPTLLLDKDSWGSLIVQGTPKCVKRNFALVYNLYPNPAFTKYVELKTKGSDLDLISICPTRKRRPGRNIVLPSISDFLWLFQNASCLYTDSFHGTAFAINFNIPFVSILPQRNSTRLSSALRMFNFSERNSNFFEGDAWNRDLISFNESNAILSKERAYSIAWLKGAIEDASK